MRLLKARFTDATWYNWCLSGIIALSYSGPVIALPLSAGLKSVGTHQSSPALSAR